MRRIGVIFGLAMLVNVVLYAMGYAQEAPAPAGQWWRPLVDMGLNSLLPALWAAVGPTIVALITAGANSLAVYVPRSVQIVLSGAITAFLAGITGDPSIGAVGQAGLAGISGQVLAATKPETLLTSERPH